MAVMNGLPYGASDLGFYAIPATDERRAKMSQRRRKQHICFRCKTFDQMRPSQEKIAWQPRFAS
jgi:hypothetical protein